MKETIKVLMVPAAVLVLFVAVFCVIPIYSEWEKDYAARAMLIRAEQTRQMLLAEVAAERDAAKIRAETIGILAETSKLYPEYKTQEFIGSLTEAIEAGKISRGIGCTDQSEYSHTRNQ